MNLQKQDQACKSCNCHLNAMDEFDKKTEREVKVCVCVYWCDDIVLLKWRRENRLR